MLKHRVIPVVLINGYSVLKTIGFNERRNLGNPITVARTYNSRNVDELVLLDIDATKSSRSIDLFTVQHISRECFMPLTVGGGLATLNDIEAALKHGADKVSINSAALENPEFIRDASRRFGSQCIVASVDVNGESSPQAVYSHSEVAQEHTLLDYCKRLQDCGVGEILLTDVCRDGAMNGCNCSLISAVAPYVATPLIYCGGVGKPDDCVEAIEAGAAAVAAASIFHFTRFTPEDCRNAMRTRGIPVRAAD